MHYKQKLLRIDHSDIRQYAINRDLCEVHQNFSALMCFISRHVIFIYS